MSDAAVRDLARDAGIAVEWEDYAGKRRRVSVPVLRRILTALGLPCDSADELRDSRETVRASAGTQRVAHRRRIICLSSIFLMRANGTPLSGECTTRASIPSRRSIPTGIARA